jgi:hypothetical protein
MGVRDDTLKMLRDGLSPKEIARNKNVSLFTTLSYIDQLIGCGKLTRSDVYFSLQKQIRDSVPDNIRDTNMSTVGEAKSYIYQNKVSVEPEDLRDIEIFLHGMIREKLMGEYGKGELNWWRKGIPRQVRKNCLSKREDDEDPVDDPYCYTTLSDLGDIFYQEWPLLKKSLPEEFKKDKNLFIDQLSRLNKIRRSVMHPVRGITPTKEDFDFVNGFANKVIFSALITTIVG